MIAGVSDNRVQNVVITLDKVKLTLSRQGQCQRAPLRLLDSDEVTDYLWTGDMIAQNCKAQVFKHAQSLSSKLVVQAAWTVTRFSGI